MKPVLAVAVMALLPLVACGGEEADRDEAAEERDEDDKKGDDDDSDPKGDDDDDDDGDGAGARFDEELSKDPCALLSPKMVAELADVKEADLEQRVIVGLCTYKWKAGGGGQAHVGFINVFNDAAKARARFDTAFKGMTGEEAAALMKDVGDRVEKKAEDGELKHGEIKVDKKSAKMASGLAGAAMAAGFSYEPVEGIGDKALYAGTRREHKIAGRTIVTYDNEMKVLVDNMYFSSAFVPKGEPKQYKEENIALAKVIVAGLEP